MAGTTKKCHQCNPLQVLNVPNCTSHKIKAKLKTKLRKVFKHVIVLLFKYLSQFYNFQQYTILLLQFTIVNSCITEADDDQKEVVCLTTNIIIVIKYNIIHVTITQKLT